MMNILFDGRVFQFQRAGGINRYFAEIISGLPHDWVPVVTGVNDFGQNRPAHPKLCVKNPPQFRPGRLRWSFQRHWWRPHVARSIRLLHPTYYDLTSGFSYSDFTCPIVTTVHDMIYARYAAQIDGSAGVIHAQRESVLRADCVVCVSRATETDLLEMIPEAAGKTTVIYHGSSYPVRDASESDKFETPTFLYVGYRGGYKNFFFLLRAFAKAASAVPDIRLNVVGAPLTQEERWQIHFLGIAGRVNSIEFPTEVTLERLYRESLALLYPSRHEGFGMPPLEAMACGTVPVTADTTSLPEVVGDGGIMLDPTDECAWADCIVKLARPFPERDVLLQRAKSQAQRFSWSECVRRHLELYRKVSGVMQLAETPL